MSSEKTDRELAMVSEEVAFRLMCDQVAVENALTYLRNLERQIQDLNAEKITDEIYDSLRTALIALGFQLFNRASKKQALKVVATARQYLENVLSTHEFGAATVDGKGKLFAISK